MAAEWSPRCLRCNTYQQTNIRLGCTHTLCLVCLSFISIKAECRHPPSPTSIQCPLCGQSTKLRPEDIELIQTTIRDVVVPQFHQTLSYQPELSPHSSGIQYTIEELPEPDSPERCSNHKFTGITTMNQSVSISLPIKSLGSYASSPKPSAKECCRIHPFQEYMLSCNDCGNEFVCLKCFGDGRHGNHNVRSIKTTVELCAEQMKLSKLQMMERIQLLQLTQKKLVNRKQLLKSRLVLSEQKVAQAFQEIRAKLRMKELQISRKVRECFMRVEGELEEELGSIRQKIQDARDIFGRIEDSNPNESSFQYIRSCLQLQKQLQKKDEPAIGTLNVMPYNREVLEIPNAVLLEFFQIIDKVSLVEAQHLDLRFNRSTKDLRLETVPSFRNKSYQKMFRTEKTDPGEDQSMKQSRFRMKNLFQETLTKNSPSQRSQFLSRQLSCQNIHKQRQQQLSIVSNQYCQSFVTSAKPEYSRQFKQGKERKTAGNMNLLDRPQKIEKKLKKVINRNR